jgi:hypothetical protein
MFRTFLTIAFVFATTCMAAAQAGSMEAMMKMTENSVGYMASGTSLEPRTTSEFESMIHVTFDEWMVMVHANAFLSNIQQSGPRGNDKLFATTWFMPMASRDFGRSSVTLRAMWSTDPATVTQRRYPELFQSGETAYGLPIVDGQHPHELWMEIAGKYAFHASERTGVYLYGGPIGEPALGPTPFPHRASASENPLAVLGHHQQDSTHIASSVITVGFVGGPVQLEASGFHGREPGENRWNLDIGKPNSFSSRITAAAGNDIVGQFSVARINNREALEPDLDTLRMTASIMHTARLGSGHIASSLIWGRNKDLDHHGHRIFNAYTLESTANFLKSNWVWTRIENVDRDQTLIAGETPAALTGGEDPIGRVQAYTFGYERDLPLKESYLRLGLGAQITTYGVAPVLKPIYGDRPFTFVAFLRLRPRGNVGPHMRMMH